MRVQMSSVDGGEEEEAVTRWVCTEFLEPEVAARVKAHEPGRFSDVVAALERDLAAAKRSGDFADVEAWYSPFLTFFSARSELRPNDLRRCVHVVFDIVYAVAGDISSQARWGSMATRILETQGKKLKKLEIEWRPLYEILMAHLDGQTTGYNGAIPMAVHQAVLCRLAQKARRHFSSDAPSEIWATLEPKIRSVDTVDCFEGVGLLHLLMPCMRVGDPGSPHPWSQWMDEWVGMSRWMITNRFWLAAWHGIFAQLSKHDTSGVIDWDKHGEHIWTVSLWFMEIPVGSSEGACPFGRRSPSRAAYLFSRSAADGEQRMKFVTKLLLYRLGDGVNGDPTGNPSDTERCATMEAIECLVDAVENYVHPSNTGRWTQTLALFLQGLVKYLRKRSASKRHAQLPPGLVDRIVKCAMRLVYNGMYSKNGTMRAAAAVAIRQLAYIQPAATLPLVMQRFTEAVEHSTATHQLTAALSVLSSCLRPMLLAPREVFEGGTSVGDVANIEVPRIPLGEYLAATLDATLPGIDANDPSKTLGTIRLYVAVVSNMKVLADPGMTGASESFLFLWSEWLRELFRRFFVFFENVDSSKATHADGADKPRGGAGGEGGVSYLMGSSSMYSPLMRLIFARMHPSLRPGAVKQLAHFVLTSTHSGLTSEVGQMVMVAVTQVPEEAVPHLTRPLLDVLTEEVDDVCRVAADNMDGSLPLDKIVSPTKEAKLKWLTGLLGAGLHYGGPRIVALSKEIRAVCAKLFELCDTAKSWRLAEMGAHLLSLLCGAMTGTYVNDLFVAEDDMETISAPGGDVDGSLMPARWVVSKVKGDEQKDGTAGPLPRPFLWRRPAADELTVAQEIADEFLRTPSDALLKAFGVGGDGEMNKDQTRAALAMIGGAASGFRTRMADFAPTPADGVMIPSQAVVIGSQDVIPAVVSVEVRSHAASAIAAVLEGVSTDDTETLSMALMVAEDILSPFNRDYHGCRAALRTWHADAALLTQPKIGHDGHKRRPRWLVGEYTFLRFLWRSSQAAYFAGGPKARPPSDRGYAALLAASQRMSLHKYRSVRAHARSVVEGCMKRFPSSASEMCAPAHLALAARPADEDRCVAACALLKCTTSVNLLRTDPAHFRAVAAALLGSSHHDAEKAQSAVNELFLSIAIKFSRSQLRAEADTFTLHPDLQAAREHIFGLMSATEKDPEAAAAKAATAGAEGEACENSPGAILHWTYSLMANALLLFLVHPRLSKEELAQVTRYVMSCMLGNLKVLRMPAVCVLLMISRYNGWDEVGMPVVRGVLTSRSGTLATILGNLGLCHHVSDREGGGRQSMGRADTLVQAAENLYGAGSDMSGGQWPRTKGGDISLSGCFMTACARLFKLFAAAAPEAVARELEAPLAEAAAAQGDRGARCAAAEALAGILASPHIVTDASPNDGDGGGARAPWAGPLLLKNALEVGADSTEEWLRAIRYAVRGEGVGEGATWLLRALTTRPDKSSGTVAQQARWLELALMAVAQLASPPAGLPFQEALVTEMAAEGGHSPLAHDSRAVREEAAKVAALLIGTHSCPAREAFTPGLAERAGEEVDPAALARLREGAKALLAQFVEGAPAAGKDALVSNPAQKAAAGGAAEAAMEVDGGDAATAPPGRGPQWLEGVMMTVIQLAKHGDATWVLGDIARLLPTILRVQEVPDRDFALVAKRTLTYIKYLVFPREHLGVLVTGILEGLGDSQWHARAASLKFLQAFAFRHAFLLTAEELSSLRDGVLDRLVDQQIEVRLLAGDTLICFLRGAGARGNTAGALRARCLAAARPPSRERKKKRVADAPGGHREEEVDAAAEQKEALRRHGAVLGISACILSSPYGVPPWMPEALETLARWSGEPSPVKETVRRTFNEFKKTHQDAWAQTKGAFTAEQWENISVGMELAPSYIC